MNQYRLKPAYAMLIVALLNSSAFLALFLLRSFDDNRLTSWQWVFAQVDVVPVFSILILGLCLAYILSRLSSLDRHPLYLFLSSFFAAAIFWSEPEVIVDASRYFTQAKHLELYGPGYFFREWGRGIMAWTDLPLVPFLYGLIFRFLGEQRIYIQIFTTLLFSTTVLLTYCIGKSLWDETTGFVGGSLLLGIPYLYSQVPLMLVDVPTMFFLTLSIFSTIKGLEGGHIRWMVLAPVSLLLTFFSKYSAWLWLTVLPIIFLVFLIDAPKRTIKRSGVIALFALLLVGAGILLHYDVILHQMGLLRSYQGPGLRRWGEGFHSTFLFQIHPFITFAALYSIYRAFKKRDRRYGIISCLLLLLLLMQIKRIRYTLPLFPMLTLMAAYGLTQIKNREIMRFILYSIFLSSVLLAYFAYLPFLQRISAVNLKEAGKFLNTLHTAPIEVLTLPQKKSIINPAISVPVLDLFTDRRILYDMETAQNKVPWQRIKQSAVRFTWAYGNPPYYRTGPEGLSGEKGAMVVIASGSDQALPRDIEQRSREYQKLRIFRVSAGVFRFRTIVRIYYD